MLKVKQIHSWKPPHRYLTTNKKIMKTINENHDIYNLTNSKTFKELLELSRTAPLNTPEEIKTAQARCLIKMCNAMDNNHIHFDNNKDAVFFSVTLIIILKSFFGDEIIMPEMRKH